MKISHEDSGSFWPNLLSHANDRRHSYILERTSHFQRGTGAEDDKLDASFPQQTSKEVRRKRMGLPVLAFEEEKAGETVAIKVENVISFSQGFSEERGGSVTQDIEIDRPVRFLESLDELIPLQSAIKRSDGFDNGIRVVLTCRDPFSVLIPEDIPPLVTLPIANKRATSNQHDFEAR